MNKREQALSVSVVLLHAEMPCCLVAACVNVGVRLGDLETLEFSSEGWPEREVYVEGGRG